MAIFTKYYLLKKYFVIMFLLYLFIYFSNLIYFFIKKNFNLIVQYIDLMDLYFFYFNFQH